MIQVVADKANAMYKKGEIITKINPKGERVLKNALRTHLHKRRSGPPGQYNDLLSLYISIFGSAPAGDHTFREVPKPEPVKKKEAANV